MELKDVEVQKEVKEVEIKEEVKEVEIKEEVKEVEIKEVKQHKEDLKDNKSIFAKCFDFICQLVFLLIKTLKYVCGNAIEALKYVLNEIVKEIVKIAITVIAYIICLHMLVSFIEIYSGIPVKSFIYELFYSFI